jgi:hypothetical protein
MARASIERLLAVAPRHGGTLLVVLLPDRSLLGAAADASALRLAGSFRATLQELHVSHLDLLTAWTPAEAEALYLPDGRLGPLAHDRIASQVAARVERILDAL